MPEIRLSLWARKIGVSLERARQWAREKRIKARNILGRVWMVDDQAKRPKSLKPWDKTKGEL